MFRSERLSYREHPSITRFALGAVRVLGILAFLVLAVIAVPTFASDGCPHAGSVIGGTWYQGGTNSQPDYTDAINAGATEFCYKAGQVILFSSTPLGGSENEEGEWIINGMEQGLSHWMYFVPSSTATPTPETPTEPPDTSTPTETPPTPTPTDTPPTSTPTPECEECEPSPTPTFSPTPPKECNLIPQYEQWKLWDSDQGENYISNCYIISVEPPSVERQASLCTLCGDQLEEEGYRYQADRWRHGTVYLDECTGEYVFIFDGGTRDDEWSTHWFRGYMQDNIRTQPRCPDCEAQATAQASN